MKKEKEKKSCNCLAKSTKTVVDHLKNQLQEECRQTVEVNEKDSGYTNRVLTFTSGYKLMMPFELKYTPIKANGEKGKEKTKKISVFPTYCPFCGKKQNV